MRRIAPASEPVVPRPTALGGWLRRLPVAPVALADALGGASVVTEFRRIVRAVLPDEAQAILAARQPDAGREASRVWAFMERIQRLFPCYELDEYEQVVCGIPFWRDAWDDERLHDLDLPAGQLLLLALCQQPYELDSRVSLLDACEAHVGRDVLLRIPGEGVHPRDLHARLDGTPFEPAALFADWVWGDTGSAFLDLTDDMEVSDADWTRENVNELARQWTLAETLRNRISAFCAWLEADPAARFEQLLGAALGEDAHTRYLQEQPLYACELTPTGLVPVPHPEVSPESAVALPLGAAA